MPFTLRRLSLGEMGTAAAVHRAAFDQRLPWLSGLHTPEQDHEFFRRHVFTECEVWGAFKAELIGIIAFREGWVDQLYVLPEHQGEGAGDALLERAKEAFDRLQLWTFQKNTAARRFYEKRGFVVIDETDGSDNEEREPDMLYRWLRAEVRC